MSERLLKILLSELERIRIVCEVCKTVVEIPISNLGNAKMLPCPGCQAPNTNLLRSTNQAGSDAFTQLAQAITTLRQLKKIEVEFVVSEPATTP